MSYEFKSTKTAPYKYLLRLFTMLVPLMLVSIVFFDQRISQFLGREDLHWFWQLNRDYTNIALSENYFALSFLVYFAAQFVLPRLPKFQSASSLAWIKNLRNWSINFFVSLVFCGIFLHLFKNIFGRQRPHISTPEFNAHIFKFFEHHWDFQSLPSGHAQVSFTAATLFSVLFPKFKAWFFAAACVLAFTRVATLDHFLSDVMAGAFLGYAGSLVALWLMKTKTKYGVLT